MEVHAHTHTPRKKWTHYFWEFFMLFLPVTLGFFVENQREHYIEHKREKQFIATLVEDLKSDTAQLNQNIIYRKNRERMVDSLILLLSLPDNRNYGADIYFYARNLSRPQYFFPNDRTLQQLKNSGAMRLIRKLSVSDSIMFYDQSLRYLQLLFTDEIDMRDQYRSHAIKIFNGRIFNEQHDSENIALYKKPQGNPPLVTYDLQLINEFIVSAQYLKSVIKGIRARQENTRNIAERLLVFLQKEYHLK